MNPFVQSPCQRCGATVWIPTATGFAYCPQCNTPAQMQPGAAQASASQQGAQPAIAATVAIPQMATPPPSMQGGPPQAFGGGFQPPSSQQGAPQQPGFGAPQQPGFGAPQQPGFGAPQQPGFGAPQQPGFGAPQQPGFGAPQQGGYGQPGGFPQPGGYGQPGGFPQQGAYAVGTPAAPSRGGMLKVILPVLGVVALSCFGALARSGLKGYASPGHRSLSAYSIDEHAADPDAMIRASGELARSWRNDAVFSSININGMSPSGTVDLSNSSHTVTVEYFSPSRVSSFLERDRRDAIKKFTFTASGINYATTWGVRRRTENPTATPTPACSTRQLGTMLSSLGVPASAEMHVQYDPTFAFVVGGAYAWHVTSSAPALDRWYDAATCAYLRGR